MTFVTTSVIMVMMIMTTLMMVRMVTLKLKKEGLGGCFFYLSRQIILQKRDYAFTEIELAQPT